MQEPTLAARQYGRVVFSSLVIEQCIYSSREDVEPLALIVAVLFPRALILFRLQHSLIFELVDSQPYPLAYRSVAAFFFYKLEAADVVDAGAGSLGRGVSLIVPFIDIVERAG